jgi:site-specific recombinase XerD
MRKYQYPPEMLEHAVSANWDMWLTSYERYLQASATKDVSIVTYLNHLVAFGRYLSWQQCSRISDVTQELIRDFLILSSKTHSPFTVKLQFNIIRIFFHWLVREGELERDPTARLRVPKVPDVDRSPVTEDEIIALLKACEGNEYEQRRDMAIIRLLLDSGMRIGELVNIKLAHIDMTRDHNSIRVFGKGDQFRDVPFGRKTALAIDRYLRKRIEHKQADNEYLWLSAVGGLSRSGVRRLIETRATQAGIPVHLHPHLFRHTFAHLWLNDGGQEGDLRAIGGWRSDVMRKYGKKLAGKRAMDAHKRHSPGDKF